jgi:hypothetical protein
MSAARAPQRASKPWRSVNGIEILEQLLRDRADLRPFELVAMGSLDGSVSGSTTTVTAQLAGDDDFYAIQASVGIIDGAAAAAEGFTARPGASPDFWHADVDIVQDRGGRRLSNLPVSLASIFGRGDRPFTYPVPWHIKSGTEIRVRVRSLTTRGTNPTSFYLTWHGLKRAKGAPPLPALLSSEPRMNGLLSQYRDAGRVSGVEPFFYSLLVGHDANGSTTGFSPMAAEAPSFTVVGGDFAVCYLMAEFFDENGDPAHVDGLGIDRSHHTVDLTVNDDKKVTQKPVSLWSLFGHGRRWMKLASPLVVSSGSRLTAMVTPVQMPSAATTRWLGHLTFAGARIYPGGL